jgi:hypothetical protein
MAMAVTIKINWQARLCMSDHHTLVRYTHFLYIGATASQGGRVGTDESAFTGPGAFIEVRHTLTLCTECKR